MHFISGVRSGGVEQMLINYTRLMNEKFNTNQIIVYQHKPNIVCLNKFIDAGDRCIRISDKRIHPIKNIVDTISIIKREKPDIIHAHMSLVNFLPLLCGLLCGIKIRISHSHIANKNIKSSFEEKVFKMLNILFANKLLACGYKAGKYMYGKRKFKVIHNSVNIDEFKFNDEKRKEIRSLLGVNENEILIGNVGRLTEQKNQLFLIEVMKKVTSFNHNFKLIILGSGSLKEQLDDKIHKNNLEDNIVVHDAVKNISDYYSAMDIFALPSLFEGFPVSLVEAQVSGLNSIVSSVIDKTAKLNDNVKFLDYGDSELWKQLILKKDFHSRNVDLRKFNEFNINHSYKKLYNIYKKEIKVKK